jgi:hypothetical protein
MFKKLSLFLLLINFLSADYTITEATEDTVSIEKTAWPVGSSGIIMHKVNDQHQAILARVEVISNETKTQLKILPFKDLFQDALPTLTTEPAVGDTVKMGWLHDRVLLIAPSKKSYDLVRQSQPNKEFIDADFFAVHLSKEGHPSPLKADIQNFCRAYDIGVIEFIIGKQLFKVDANSFKVLEKISVNFPEQKTKVPFYSRLESINADWWGEGSDEIEHYESYYLTLLGEN